MTRSLLHLPEATATALELAPVESPSDGEPARADIARLSNSCNGPPRGGSGSAHSMCSGVAGQAAGCGFTAVVAAVRGVIAQVHVG